MTPMAATMPSSRMMGTAMATDPEMNSPALRAMPSVGDLAEVVAQLPDVGRREGHAGGPADDLVEDLGRRVGEQRPGERPLVERAAVAGAQGHPQRLGGWDLVQADRREADAAADDGRLAGLLGEQPQERVGDPDQLLAAHVGDRSR